MNKNEIIYNEAGMDDIPAIRAMYLKHLREHPQYITHGEIELGVALTPDCLSSRYDSGKLDDYFMEMVLEGHCELIVARENRKVIGFAIFEGTGYAYGPVVTLNDLFVLPRHRGQGIGKALFEKGLEVFRNSGIKNCFIPTGCRNHFAHEFLRRQGARPATQIFHLIINDPSEIIFPEEITED